MAEGRGRLVALGVLWAAALAVIAVIATRTSIDKAPDPRAELDGGEARPSSSEGALVGADGAASRAPSASSRPDGPTWAPAPGCPDWSYDRGLARGRRLAGEGKFPEAMTAFEEAIRAEPFDARARAERASVRRRAAGRDPSHAAEIHAALHELELAASLTDERPLLAEIAFEKGLAHEALGEAESARVAFAIAEHLGSTAAAKKLGDRSRCTVTVGERVEDLATFSTWKAALAALEGPGCEVPDTKDEAEARAFACGGCDTSAHVWTKGECKGEGPWTMSTGYMSCTMHTGVVFELAPGRLHALWSVSDGKAFARTGTLWTERATGNSLGELDAEFAGGAVGYRIGEGWSDLADADQQGACPGDERAAETLTTSYGCGNRAVSLRSAPGLVFYDDHGRWRATLLLHDAEAEKAKTTVHGEVLEVRGGGCSFDVPLAGTAEDASR